MSDPKALPRPCWFKVDRDGKWLRGTLHAWNTIADETGSEPVGIVEGQAGNVHNICVRFLALGEEPPPAATA